MLARVVPLPGERIGQPEVRAQVDDLHTGGESPGKAGRLTRRQREEHKITAVQLSHVMWLQQSIGKDRRARQVRMQVADALPGAGISSYCRDLKIWMRG
jgi:hypothetical protein